VITMYEADILLWKRRGGEEDEAIRSGYGVPVLTSVHARPKEQGPEAEQG